MTKTKIALSGSKDQNLKRSNKNTIIEDCTNSGFWYPCHSGHPYW